MNGKAVHKDTHEFALFIDSLSLLIQGKSSESELTFSDEKLVHRMMNVLRLTMHDSCLFFDREVEVCAIIARFIGKKQVAIIIRSIKKTTSFQPVVTFLLPLLKRDDYESALYGLTEVGVNTIQLVFTHKSVHQWSGERDNERARRILISAAEQSKNFAYPELKEPISLEQAVKKYSTVGVKMFFDPEGQDFFEVMQMAHNAKATDIVLLVGPEADLNGEEKRMIRQNGFVFCALTPTIMRAFQAAALGAGFVRSLLVSTTN